MATYGEAKYAACDEHALAALRAMRNRPVEIRAVKDDPLLVCGCRKPADWFLLELRLDGES